MRYKKEEIKLYKRKMKSGLTVYYYRIYSPEGKRLRISTGKTTVKDARNYLDELIKEGTLIPDKKKDTTFSAFTENFFLWDKCQYVERKRERNGVSREYVEIQRLNLKTHLLPYFGQMKLINITSDDIYTWLSGFKRKKISKTKTGLSNKTANNNLNTLKVILNEAHKKGLIKANPAKDVSPLRNDGKERGILTPPEVKKLFNPDTLDEVWQNDPYTYTGILLAAVSGMRQGEILALRGKNIFPEYIHIENSFSRIEGLKTTKTGDTRDVPIAPFIQDVLNRLTKDDPELYLFSRMGDRPLEGRRLTRGLYSALKNIGITETDIKERNITFHSWRHFFNTTLRRNNLADSKVQRITGHKTQEMTENYTHWAIEDLKEITSIQGDIVS